MFRKAVEPMETHEGGVVILAPAEEPSNFRKALAERGYSITTHQRGEKVIVNIWKEVPNVDARPRTGAGTAS